MDRADLLELLTPEGLALLDEVTSIAEATDVVATVSRLRKQGHPPALVAAVLTQARLRAKARAKFGPFAERMLFTEAGLEQATRLTVAARHAGRYRDAGLGRVADLGCGVGGDAMALAAIDLEVTAVDADEVTAAIASFNLSPFPSAAARHDQAEAVDLDAFDAAFLDPARRTAGHAATRRIADPREYSPSLEFAFGLAERMPVGVKLGPGLDRSLIPDGAEAQWVSVAGQVVELGVWFGPLARPGVRRAALVLGTGGAAELTAAADAEDAPVGTLDDYLYEPDGAVIRARLIGEVARGIGATMLSGGIAYLSSSRRVDTPFATRFRVRETLPWHERELKRALRARNIGTLEIKKRGADVDPATLRTRLALKGDESATLVLTRVGGKHTALLVDRDG